MAVPAENSNVAVGCGRDRIAARRAISAGSGQISAGDGVIGRLRVYGKHPMSRCRVLG
jgi:hypothetical protein